MAIKRIDGVLFKKMIINGAINLKNDYQRIDELNVFPVPDGDTGTNMQMTMTSGMKEIKDYPTESIIDLSKMLSRGLLMGARGNSGVILSQFFRGVYLGISEKAGTDISVADFKYALTQGYKTAYKAVMEPREGTILTVVREAIEKIVDKEHKTFEELFKDYIKEAHISLENTPNLLSVLKEAGVVDSGGAGFILIAEGMYDALLGKFYELKDSSRETQKEGIASLENVDIKFGYCTEFIIKLNNVDSFDEALLKEPFSQMGDSLVVVQDEDICKVHVHTNTPGDVLSIAQQYGEFNTIKIENMRIQHSEIMSAELKEEKPVVKKELKKYALIACCSGNGIKETFKELGVDYIVDGGQSMNPSTEDFLKAIDEVYAENVIIIPNNSNIILAAEQSASLREEFNIRVLKNKSIATGYASLMDFDATQSIDDNIAAMQDKVNSMNYGEVTYAIKNTEFKGHTINQNDFMGISKGDIIAVDKSRLETTKKLLQGIVDEDREIVTIFYGLDATEEELEALENFVYEINDSIEVELIEGKQDIYTYIIAVE